MMITYGRRARNRAFGKSALAGCLGLAVLLPASTATGAPAGRGQAADSTRITGPVAHVVPAPSSTRPTIYFMQAVPQTVEVFIDRIDAGQFPGRTTAGFSYSQTPAPAGPVSAAIYPAGSGPGRGTALASTTGTLVAGSDYTLESYVDSSGQDQLGLFPFDDRSPPSGRAQVVIRNTADSSPVDVYANGTKVVSDLADNPAHQQTAEVLVPTGTVKFTVTGAGDPAEVLATNRVSFDPASAADLDVTGAEAGGSTSGTIALQGFSEVLPTGYWEASRTGAVYAEGTVDKYGSLAGAHLAAPIVGMVASSDGLGYYLVSSDGGVFAFGDATYHGSLPAEKIRVNDIVGMALTADGGGYWLVTSDGGVFSFGDASFSGSLGGERLKSPIVAMAADDYDGGYWLVASDGGVFCFGNAGFDGSLGGTHLAAPIVGMVPIADGVGYWLFAADGAVFNFGLAYDIGSAAGHTSAKVVGMTVSDDDHGLRLADSDGGVYDFGTAAYAGVPSVARSSIVAIAAP